MSNRSNGDDELEDPWAEPVPPPSPPPTSTATATPVPSPGKDDVIIYPGGLPSTMYNSKGQPIYPCSMGILPSVVFGGVGGAIAQRISRQSMGLGAFQGASAMSVYSIASCWLLKQNEGSLYDHNYYRTYSMAMAGASIPFVTGLWYSVKGPMHMVAPPQLLAVRCLSGAAVGALIGGIVDYFDIGRPSREGQIQIVQKKSSTKTSTSSSSPASTSASASASSSSSSSPSNTSQ